MCLRLAFRRSFSTSPACLSGHNKWSKIKTKKGALDAKRSVVYGRAHRDIIVAVRHGGSADPVKNIMLATALKAAKTAGVPKENIEKALNKASGDKGKAGQQVLYEAMAHGSVGILIECLTDNANRTVHIMRQILTENNARFAPVGFLFQRKGSVRVVLDPSSDTDQLIEAALEAGAEDFEEGESTDQGLEFELTCAPTELGKLTAAVLASSMARELLSSELIYAPVEKAAEPDEDIESKITDLVESLEESEDCLRVWTTLDS
ncbi:hypothetical protein JAAARDRAFT_127346 [Jaapia argillacea MUCL 33604]|uniref:Transcriptional regulatory protein n=1 Tax=Jaapia argillacea MUCL 33604 TaxID=933084 RepID=A0A067Q020_9AGAM|nr:hypothetical protein JAAARDRAFT_127346 [Jaapia argillacea MUCL 33604]